MIHADGLTVHTRVSFGWRDRLRILIHGEAIVTTVTDTENLVGASVLS